MAAPYCGNVTGKGDLDWAASCEYCSWTSGGDRCGGVETWFDWYICLAYVSEVGDVTYAPFVTGVDWSRIGALVKYEG